MKLKKIASLALAGVMAVSMLAGCAGKTGTTENEGTTVVAGSSIVTAFNDGQDTVTFSSDSKMESAVAGAVKANGDATTMDKIKSYIQTLTGLTSKTLATATTSNDDLTDGMTKTQWYGKAYAGSSYWTEADAINAAVRDMKDVVKDLDENTRDGKKQGDTYYEFSYTGTVALTSYVEVDGTTTYFVTYTITQTAAKKTV